MVVSYTAYLVAFGFNDA